MTARWITVSLVALALAGCNKKEAAKPPPPKSETPAPPTATTSTATTPTSTTPTPPPAEPPPTVEPPPPVEAGPPATTQEPTAQTPSRPVVVRPRTPVLIRIPGSKAETPPPSTPPSGGRPPIRIDATSTSTGAVGRTPIIIRKTPLQVAAETNVLGAWLQSDQKTSILRFTPSGWVSLERGNDVINGKWSADSAGAINFTLPVPGGEAKLVAHYSDSKPTGRYIVVIPSQDGPQIWPRYGQLIFNPQVK